MSARIGFPHLFVAMDGSITREPEPGNLYNSGNQVIVVASEAPDDQDAPVAIPKLPLPVVIALAAIASLDWMPVGDRHLTPSEAWARAKRERWVANAIAAAKARGGRGYIPHRGFMHQRQVASDLLAGRQS